MKKLIPLLGVIVTITLAIIIITINTTNKGFRYLTVNNHYSYVYTETKKIEIPIYANNSNCPLSNITNYSSVYLSSKDETKKLQIEVTKIQEGQIEYYINESYFLYTLFFEMPKLSSNFFIDDCQIKIRLINNSEYTFNIGKISLYYYDNIGHEELLSIHSLSGMKSSSAIISRLEEIKIEGTFNDNYPITNIIAGNNLKATYYKDEEEIIIHIAFEELMLNNIPIIIEYKEGSVLKRQIIDNFKYFTDYDILYQNGILVNVY